MSFGEGFVWGAATSAYQIEGAVAADGRTPSIWDTFSHTPGRVLAGHTGDDACDHYHRFREDIAIMADLGLGAYRFSIAWPRILPDPGGRVNSAGLDFYSALVDELLSRGIQPMPTLYHWDLPQYLQDDGGWTNRATADRFADYAVTVARHLGDRLPAVTTLNEPWCSAFLGYATGEHAPGLTDNATALAAAHHLLLAHGKAVQALRAELPASTALSITLNPAQLRPASDSAEDAAAVRRADAAANRIFLDPLFGRGYPAELIEATAATTDWSFVLDGDLATIGTPFDFLGVNFYEPASVAATPPADQSGEPHRWPGLDDVYSHPHPKPWTGMGWTVDPPSLTELLQRLGRDYPGVYLMITENGAAYPDSTDESGRIVDRGRADYLTGHIAAVQRAIETGVDVRGYFAWSLLDNFEWAWGYTQRFGMVHVDFESQQRQPKLSAEVYRDLIAAHTAAHRLQADPR
jgi:beta-glucosidase